MRKSKKSGTKQAIPKEPSAGIAAPAYAAMSITTFRQRIFELHSRFLELSPEQKTAVVQESISLLETFHQTIATPDKDFYTLSLKLWIDFCRSTPDHHQHVPMLFKTVLDVLNRAKDIELPQIATIYHFAIMLVEEYILRNIKGMLQNGFDEEHMMEVSFEDIFTIFQQFLTNINHKKTSEFSAALQQHELAIYNKFIFILVIANTTNKLSVPELADAWKGATLRILIKVFKQAETTHLSLKWTSYNHMVMALACTPNPNIDVLFHCFDQIRTLGFFEPATAPKAQQGAVTTKDLHQAFCVGFFQGVQHILNYDNTHNTTHFTSQYLRKTLKVINYLQAQGLLDTITPFIFDIFAHAPYHSKIDRSIKKFFQIDYPFQSDLLAVIFKGLSRCQSLDPEDLRFFFDYSVAHHLLQADTPETQTILEHLFKSLTNLAQPQTCDIILYLDSAVALGYANSKSFDAIMYALTKVKPAVTEETLFYCFNTISPLPCLAAPNQSAGNMINNVLLCLEPISAPRDTSLQSLCNFIEHSGHAFPKRSSFRLIRLLAHFPEFCKQLAASTPQLFGEYRAYQDLYQAHSDLVIVWNSEELHEPFSTLVTAIQQFADTIIEPSWDKHYSPSEKLYQLQSLNTELTRLQGLETTAKLHDVRSKQYYQRIQKELLVSLPNINIVQAIVNEFGDAVEQAQQKAKDLKEQLSFETIWIYIKSKDIDKLEKANICLDRLIASPNDPHNYHHLVAKIHCLINLGKYDQAMVWLNRAKIACQNGNDRSLRINFALCCKKLGQFPAAIQIREQIRDELKKSRSTHVKIANLLELALCHKLAEGTEHYQAALAIYAELKTQNIPLSSIQLLEVDIHIADCYIKLNQFSRAEEQLNSITDGKDSPKVLLTYAWLYQVQQHYGRAKSIYLKLIARQDNTEMTWRTLFRCSHALPSKELTLVRQHIHTLLENTPIQSKALLNEKIMVFMQEKRYQEAFEVLNQMRQIWGKDEFLYIGLAICHRHLQNVDTAITMLTDFPDYRENRKIVMQLVECYQLKQDAPKLLACFDLLLMRFQTHTLGIYKAIRYYCEQGHIDKIQYAWEQCRMHCKESPLLREIEQLVQPYLSKSNSQAPLPEFMPIKVPSLDPTMMTRLELEDVFEDLDATFAAQREEDELREMANINPRYVPNLLTQTRKPAISNLIKALDLALPRNFTIFKDQQGVEMRTSANEQLRRPAACPRAPRI